MCANYHVPSVCIFYLVGVVDVANESFDPVLVVGVGPLGTQMGEGGRGVQQIGVVEVLKEFVRLLFVREEGQNTIMMADSGEK